MGRPAAPDDRLAPDEARKASSAWSATSVTRSSSSESTSIRATSIATLPLPITDRALGREVELEVGVVGVAVVPGDELGGGVRAGAVPRRGCPCDGRSRADRVDRPRRSARQLLGREVARRSRRCRRSESPAHRGLVEHPRHGLDVRMVGRDARAHQAEGVGSMSNRSSTSAPAFRKMGRGVGEPGTRPDDRHLQRGLSPALSRHGRRAR